MARSKTRETPAYRAPDHLFTLKIPVVFHEFQNKLVVPSTRYIVINAFDAGPESDTHHRIEVTVDFCGKGIFGRTDLWCGLPAHKTIDGDDAKELVMTLVAMTPGDTDMEYFANYTPEQCEFVEKYGELIRLEAKDRYGER